LSHGAQLEAGAYEFDSDCLEDLYEFYVANTLFQVIVENATVELSSRTMAMDNATRNANQMIDRLTLFYNRSRQATITKELIEIISGACTSGCCDVLIDCRISDLGVFVCSCGVRRAHT
jgi:F-type H+-transporting ATPase subunit gamma